MTSTPSVYQSLITARSRRLRTIGSLLMIAVVGMTLYGYFGLMPSLRATLPNPAKNSAPSSASPPTVRPNVTPPRVAAPSAPLAHMSRQERDAEAAKLIFAYAYWGVCVVLLIALLLIAWLDFREVSRSYDQYRLAVFNATAQTDNQQTE